MTHLSEKQDIFVTEFFPHIFDTFQNASGDIQMEKNKESFINSSHFTKIWTKRK